MEKSIIVLSSSPPLPEASKQYRPSDSEEWKKFVMSRDDLQTPKKKHEDIQNTPSSSPLPSPGEIIRGLLQPRSWFGERANIGKGFKSAKELLQVDLEEESFPVAKGTINTKQEYIHDVKYGDNKVQGNSSLVTKPKAKARRETTAKPRKTVKKTATVSSHFSKRNKIASISTISKNLSTEEQTKPDAVTTNFKTTSAPENITRPSRQESEVGLAVGLGAGSSAVESVPPVPARRRDWTPVKNTIKFVEIVSSPTVQRADTKEYTDDSQGLDSASEGGKESSLNNSAKRNFGDQIELFKYDSNSTAAASTCASVVPEKSLCFTRKRCIELHEKPRAIRSMSTVASSIKPPKKETRKSRKKTQTITDLATAQYRPEEDTTSTKAISILDFLTKKTPESTEADSELQPAKRPKRQPKSKVAKDTKETAKPRRGRKVSKEKVEEPIELLSPQSAIKSVNEQKVIFGTWSQLTHENDTTTLHTEAPGPKAVSSSSIVQDMLEARFEGPSNADIHHLYENDIEALEEFLESEFDEENAKKAKARLKKRKGLWEAASKSHDISETPFIDLSMVPDVGNQNVSTLSLEGMGRRNSLLGNIPAAAESGQNPSPPAVFESPTKRRKARSDTEKPPTQSDTPAKRRKKTASSITSEEDLPRATRAQKKDDKGPGIPPVSRKKPKPKPTDNTESTQQPQKTKKGKRATSPVQSSPKRRTVSPPFSPTRKRRQSLSAPAGQAVTFVSSIAKEFIESSISKAINMEHSVTNNIADSWHYKILTYEPIVLEDFTIWLNTVGLGLVGIDDEVAPEVVKEWAEARAVVNVARETNRGRERKRL